MNKTEKIDLTKTDKQNIESFEHSKAVLADHAIDVIRFLDEPTCGEIGLWVYGRGGTLKTHTIKTVLKEHGIKYVYHNGRLTPVRLYVELYKYPDCIHIIDDAENIFQDKNAVTVLRPAWDFDPYLDDSKKGRLVQWKLGRAIPDQMGDDGEIQQIPQSFRFKGAIIFISNLPPDRKKPDVDAMCTRITPIHWRVTDDEVLSSAKKFYLKGSKNRGLSTTECLTVMNFIQQECEKFKIRLDFRLFDKAMSKYASWKHYTKPNGKIKSISWKEKIEVMLKGEILPTIGKGKKYRAIKLAEIAAEVRSTDGLSFREQVEDWRQRLIKVGEVRCNGNKVAYTRWLKRAEDLGILK